MKVLYPVLIGLLATMGGLLILPSPTQAKDDGMAIAMAQDIPGKNNVGGHGSEYVVELYNRFHKAGGEAYLVTYNWRREFEKPEQARLGGAVIFRDAEGRYWGMDMYTSQPVWVPGKEPQKWIDRMYPSLITKVATVKTDAKLAGQYADFSRVANSTPEAAPAATAPAPAEATPQPAPAGQPSAGTLQSMPTTIAVQ